MSSAALVGKITELPPKKKPLEKQAEPNVLDQETVQPVDNGLPSPSIVALASESGSMLKASQILPENRWAAPSFDSSTEECDRKHQPTSLGVVGKIAMLSISQPKKKPLERKAEPNVFTPPNRGPLLSRSRINIPGGRIPTWFELHENDNARETVARFARVWKLSNAIQRSMLDCIYKQFPQYHI